MKTVTRTLKAIHPRESKAAYRKKAKEMAEMLRAMQLPEAAKKIEEGVEKK